MTRKVAKNAKSKKNWSYLEAISKMVFMQKAAVNVMLSGAKHP